MDSKRVFYQLPGMDRVLTRRDVPYKPNGNPELTMDAYAPSDIEYGDRRPAVIFVHGEVPPKAVPYIKNWGQYVSWGQFAAASGMVGITFNHRSTERYSTFAGATEDIDDLIAHVRNNAEEFNIDRARLGIWTCSGGAYLGLRAAFRNVPEHIRCVVSYYGILDIARYLEGGEACAEVNVPDDLSPLFHLTKYPGPFPPMLLVRAGGDHPKLNATFDWFLNECLARNVDVECINNPEAPHAFDILDDSKRTGDIIRRTLQFFSERLMG